MVYRAAAFSMISTTHNPNFKVTPLFNAEYLNGIRYKYSYNEILLGTYALLKVPFRMTLSDLAKYLMTRSIARSLCAS